MQFYRYCTWRALILPVQIPFKQIHILWFERKTLFLSARTEAKIFTNQGQANN